VHTRHRAQDPQQDLAPLLSWHRQLMLLKPVSEIPIVPGHLQIHLGFALCELFKHLRRRTHAGNIGPKSGAICAIMVLRASSFKGVGTASTCTIFGWRMRCSALTSLVTLESQAIDQIINHTCLQQWIALVFLRGDRSGATGSQVVSLQHDKPAVKSG
jgi:hypothetical protein